MKAMNRIYILAMQVTLLLMLIGGDLQATQTCAILYLVTAYVFNMRWDDL